MIEGILIKKLKVFSDERGKVMHMLRSDDSIFKNFGEVYFSVVNPGFVKGWKKHLRTTQHFAVPVGNIELVIYDDREKSSTKGQIQEIATGIDNYQLIRIPPGVWYSFRAVGNQFALIANCIDSAYEPDEVKRFDPIRDKLPYKWNLINE